MIFNILKDTYKLLNKNLIPMYIWFFLYSFLVSLGDNFFICSYLKNTFFLDEELTNSVYLSILLLLLVLSIYNKEIYNKSVISFNIISEFLRLNYILKILKNTSLYHVITFNLNNLKMFFSFLINCYKSYIFNNSLIYLYLLIDSSFITWHPIYKTHSIYGFYRSTRFNVIDVKNENLKRLKY